MEVVVNVGIWSVVGVVALAALTGVVMGLIARSNNRAEAARSAYRDADRWCGLLRGQISSIRSNEDAVAGQALAEANAHYEYALALLATARNESEFDQVRRKAVLGLRYIGVARARLGMVAGPQGPPPLSSDGRPMYEAEYRAVPTTTQARAGDDRYQQRGKSVVPGLRGAGGN